MLTDRQRMMLSAMASADSADAAYTPVEMQKFFFLLDEEASHLIGGKQFSFEPYDYGPFDRAVYDELDFLEKMGLISIDRNGKYKRYKLLESGRHIGTDNLRQYDASCNKYMKSVANWLRASDFNTIVSSIYKAYPEMRSKSIFRG